MAGGGKTTSISGGGALAPTDDGVLLAALQNYLLAAEYEAAKPVCALADNAGFGEAAGVTGLVQDAGKRELLANLGEARKLAMAYVRRKTPQLALKTEQKSVAGECVKTAAAAVSVLYPGRVQIEVTSNRGEIFAGDGDTVVLVLEDLFKAMAAFVPQRDHGVRILAAINYDNQNNCIIEIAAPYGISNFDFLFDKSTNTSETGIIGVALCNSLLNRVDAYLSFHPSYEMEMAICLCLPGVRN